MTDAIAHRGPDGEGHWVEENEQLALGHRRLSIIDLSDAASQPMHFADRYSMVFNGEIYNYLELKEELIKSGIHFSTSSDTEVLLALYHQKREQCLQDLDGMFAFAIWDKQDQTLFCARDRFGEKPFFHAIHNGAFYFASEMKALWAAGVPKQPNKRRIFSYLAYGRLDDISTHGTTFFEEIFQLEPAHFFYLKNGEFIQKTRYWEIDPLKRDTTITFDGAQAKFVDLLQQSIQRRLRSDVPVGSSLSGGLDSSSIVMLIDRMKSEGQIQKTFSARFEGFKRDEGTYIDMINQASATEAHTVFLTPEELNKEWKTVAYYQEEPFGSTSIVAQWNVMRLAKQNDTTVLLDGQGADEYLAGYSSYFHTYLAGEFVRNRANYKKLIQQYETFYSVQLHQGRFFPVHARFPNLRDKIRKLRNSVKTPAYFRQFHPDFLKELKNTPYTSHQTNNLNISLLESIQGSSLPTLLRYADRNSMAHSREVRLPFLSHELVEFVFSLPDDFKIRDSWTKAVMRFGMRDILPEEVCWRKEKVGFEPPKNRDVSDEDLKQAIAVLTDNQILNPDHILPEKSWEYVQVSLLFS